MTHQESHDDMQLLDDLQVSNQILQESDSQQMHFNSGSIVSVQKIKSEHILNDELKEISQILHDEKFQMQNTVNNDNNNNSTA